MPGSLTSLPGPVAQRLEELKSSLVTTLGADLEALVVHGSAVRGGFDPERSDVDLVLVLRSAAEAKLEAIGPALELARHAARIEAMLVTADEVQGSADVFPLLYDEIARHSVCLHGMSPFEGLHVADDHRRLRIEQELREVRIRMRRVATDMARSPVFGGAVERKIKQTRAALHALLKLRGKEVDDGLEQVLAAAGAAYEVDVKPLRRAREEPRQAYETLCKLLDAALVDVDHVPGAA